MRVWGLGIKKILEFQVTGVTLKTVLGSVEVQSLENQQKLDGRGQG